MVFIASEWTPSSSTDVRVFSNCEEVELRLNGTPVERRRPDRDRMSTHLAHPPFTFRLGRFTPGTLTAVGYLGGREVGRHEIRSPGPIERLHLSVDLSGRTPAADGKDVLVCHASLQDAAGTVVATAWENVAFGAVGGASLVGANPFSSDAGIASILVQTEPGAAFGALYALSIVRGDRAAHILGASSAVIGPAPGYEIRYTADGSVAELGAPRYAGPIENAPPLRAVLVAGTRVVAALDETAEKFRIRGSAAPASRDPFRHG
jgi:beta-galactosidase